MGFVICVMGYISRAEAVKPTDVTEAVDTTLLVNFRSLESNMKRVDSLFLPAIWLV